MIVRPRSSVPFPSVEELGRQPLAERRHMDLRAFVAVYGADPKDLEAVAAFARDSGLEVVQSSVSRRSVALEGTVAAMAAAFGTKFSRYASPQGEYRGRSGLVHLPRELAPVVEAVLGLDDRPQAHPQIRARSAGERETGTARSFTPPEVARLYNFPSRLDGQGQRIAIIELGGGYRRAELRAYFADLGLELPKITAVSVDGVRNRPGVHAHADSEVMLDVEVIGAIVPGAELLVYFAPLTDRGFVDAVTTAVFDERRPSVISISWGDAEFNWSEQARTALDQAFQAAAVLGITVCCVSGDNGWTDGIGTKRAHVDYPASSPYVLACGGTRLEVTDGKLDETVWNNATATRPAVGVSQYYPVPSWQAKGRVPSSRNPGRRRGRGVPDVAGNADPNRLSDPARRRELKALGGTSAVGAAVGGADRAREPASRQERRLPEPAALRVGRAGRVQRGAQGTNGGYRARLGWDACTGHGTPDGKRLFAALTARA